jgi:hypothetical protein
MEGASIILGNNFRSKGRWSFDLNSENWIVETER